MLLILWLSVLTPALGATKSQTRSATPQDCIGIWRQVAVQPHEPEVDLGAPWFSALQYYWFAEKTEGERQPVKVLLVEGKSDEVERLLDEWKAAPWQDFVIWGSGGKGMMMFPVPQKQYRILFTLYTEDYDARGIPADQVEAMGERIPRKGDLSLTYVNHLGHPKFYRLLRRLD